MRRSAALIVLLAAMACSSRHTALDSAADATCQEGYVAGVAQLSGHPDVEAFHLISAYQHAVRSKTALVVDWTRDHHALGTKEQKSAREADDAVRVLLNVCHALKYVPVAPTPAPSQSGR